MASPATTRPYRSSSGLSSLFSHDMTFQNTTGMNITAATNQAHRGRQLLVGRHAEPAVRRHGESPCTRRCSRTRQVSHGPHRPHSHGRQQRREVADLHGVPVRVTQLAPARTSPRQQSGSPPRGARSHGLASMASTATGVLHPTTAHMKRTRNRAAAGAPGWRRRGDCHPIGQMNQGAPLGNRREPFLRQPPRTKSAGTTIA